MKNLTANILDLPSSPQNKSPSGRDILGRAWTLVKKYPQLAIFHLVSIAACWAIFCVFASAFEPVTNPEYPNMPGLVARLGFLDLHHNPHNLGPIAGYYFLAVFIGTFFNVGFYHETIKAFAGETPSVPRGLAFAMRRIVPILVWSLFAGSIGMVFRILAERLGLLGKFCTSVVGFAWSVAAVFAVPVLVRDGTIDPVRLLRHSSNLVKDKWGNVVYGIAALSLAPAGLLIGGILAVMFLIPKFMSGPAPLSPGLITAVIVLFVAITFYSVFMKLLREIYLCAVYIYATEGEVPGPFSSDDMDRCWKIKNS